MSIVTIIVVLLAGGLAAALASRSRPGAGRWISLGALLLAGLELALTWQRGSGSFLDNHEVYAGLIAAWIPSFGIQLILAMDGLSLLMVALTLLLGLVAVISSWTEIEERHGFFQFNLLWTLAGVVGVFTALDLFLFFLFWEVMLVPMYFLIAIWGHEQRAYAAMKFFLFTQISGLVMLLAIVGLAYAHYADTGVLTFSYYELLGTRLAAGPAALLMLGFFVGFAVKLPSVPFHTWLPDAHTQAPTAGSVILAGVLLKTGAYGLLRFVVPLFPDAAAQFRWPAMLLGAISVVYGGYMAFAQTDFKRLVAYSSISHMGFVMIGVFVWSQLAVQGAVMQMIAHGFSTAAMFMMAGALQQRLHTREMTRMGGLWQYAPRMGAITLFFVVASLGMPGLGNFVGEFMVLLGAFAVNVPLAVVASLGLVIAAVYALSLMQRSFQGAPNPELSAISDFGGRELGTMLALAAGLVWLGVHPQPIFDLSAPSVDLLRGVIAP